MTKFNPFDDEFAQLNDTNSLVEQKSSENFIEPSMSEQLQGQDNNENKEADLSHEIFKETGMKVPVDDPVIQLSLIIEKITAEKVKEITNNLEGASENIIDNLLSNQQKVNTTFDEKLDELKDILSKLENQKETIVADVWRKLNDKVTDKIQSELTSGIQKIANNSNNKVNNERMMLKGGVGGLVVGIILCAILLFVFK